MGVTMITRQRLAELASKLSEAVTHGAGIAVADIADELHAASVEPERRPFVPAAQYAGNGGASMADAIEALESKLSAVELVLDAHRAALVAAGWLDVNGNVTARDDQR